MKLRHELAVAVGGVQLRAIEAVVGAAARMRTRATDDGVAYLARPARRGLPLACAHGFGGDKETWLLMTALLPATRGVVAVDLPGHGHSADVAEDAASIRHHAEAMLRVLDREGIDRAIACGNSMGGGVALRLAASWPDRIAGLVLVASVGRDVHEGPARAWTTDGNPLIPREEDIERFMELALERPPPVGKAVIRHVVTERARRAEHLYKLFRGFILRDGEAGVPVDVTAITQRALVIHGEQDRIISKRVAEDLTLALPHAELVVMRGVGHAPQLEAPRAMARIVEGFARRIDSALASRRDPA